MIEWFARTNKLYGVYYIENLTNGAELRPVGTWTNVAVTTDGLTNVPDSAISGVTQRFYKITVHTAP